MPRYVFSTPFGEAWLWGRLDPAEADRPVVLFINGAFSVPEPRTFELQDYLPEASVLNAHLPGNHCPFPVSHSVGVYAAIYGAVLRQIGRPAVVGGGGLGADVALAIRAPQVRGVVLAEPLLVTSKAWPLVEGARERLTRYLGQSETQAFCWNLLGVSKTEIEERDYRPLLDELKVPAWALYGTVPLNPPRPVDETPSLVDEPERALLRDHPLIRVREVEGVGHNVPGRAVTYVRTAARDLLQRECGTGTPAAQSKAS